MKTMEDYERDDALRSGIHDMAILSVINREDSNDFCIILPEKHSNTVDDVLGILKEQGFLPQSFEWRFCFEPEVIDR